MLEDREGRDGGGLSAQDARPHAYLLEARADGELLLLGREPALRADEERGGARQCELAGVELARRREKQFPPALSSLPSTS
jgi:hypothetical protein